MRHKDYSPADRVLARIKVDPGGCWNFTGYLDKYGYGRVTVEGKSRYTHRVVYEDWCGPIPYDLTIDHLCFNSGCVNPTHLEAVSTLENNRRKVAANRHFKPTERFWYA